MPTKHIVSSPAVSGVKRCPACQRDISAVYAPACPHCNAELPHDHVTSDDTTPFAQTSRRNRQARRIMRRWVYTASGTRLTHLALIRRSPASRAFVRWHLLVLGLAAACAAFSSVGWHRVVRTADNASLLRTSPSGRSWVSVVSGDVSPVTLGLTSLWWNPVQAAIAVTLSFVSGWMVACMMIGVLNWSAKRITGIHDRSQERLLGAIHYSTAWCFPAMVGSLVLLALPIRDMIVLAGFRLVPPRGVVEGTAAAIAGLAALMWWFWLTRVASTLPETFRTRSLVYFSLVAPAVCAGLLVGWLMGMQRLFALLWPLFKLTWSGVS